MSVASTPMTEAEHSPLRAGAFVYVTLTPRAPETDAVLTDPARLLAVPFADVSPDEGVVDRLADAYAHAGCTIAATSRVGLTLRVPAGLCPALFGAEVSPKRIRLIREFERFAYEADGPLRPRLLPELVARAAPAGGSFELETPAPALARPDPPEIGYHHLDLPHDIVALARTEAAHAAGIDGRGVRVAMIDTGFFAHPYYARRGFRPERVAAVPDLDPARDERGHGTAMTAVLTAVAPGIDCTFVKMADEAFGFPIAALQTASRLDARVVNCSWGLIGADPQVHLELANLADLGAIVVAAAGNGSDDRPDAMFQSLAAPFLISVGGCRPGPDGRLAPATIASSFTSRVWPERRAPDVSGPCGDLPAGYLIVFPTQPGCQFDRRNGRGDGTAPDDGWLVSSGTSAASAYVAGAVALALQAHPELDRTAIAAALAASAEPVLPIPDGPDVGAGFVRVDRLLAHLDETKRRFR